MFRIVVISLFVANLFLVGFQVSKPPRKTEVVPADALAVGETNIPTIYLFSEMIQDQGLMTGNRQCFTLGPFHNIEDMYAVRNRLQEISLSTNDRQTLALVEKGYWVFLRPYRSLLEANEELLTLQAFGLTDIGVIYEGEYTNSISLGYFLRRENALKRKQALEAKGYEPLMRVQRQSEPRYWLDYEQNPGSDLIALDMQSRPNDFMQRSLPCPEQSQLAVVSTEAKLLKAELPDSEPLDSEPPASEPPELQANVTESVLQESKSPESKPLNTASLESELPNSEPLESASAEPDLLMTGPQVSELPETEPPESGLQKFGPPVLEPMESGLPANPETPVATDAPAERDGAGSEDG